MFPTPDASAGTSFTPFQTWAIAATSAAFDLGQVILVVAVAGFALLLFAFGIVAVTSAYRR